ncbi:hypothetical protein [Nocardioides humi]|uniref:Phage tail tape measure protein n=1 Tax=Nocardioides humi TaxID=449461 RepID=A0ABN2BMN0_9ACTN|nr:hypothetical protein [Nocardioides humi]
MATRRERVILDLQDDFSGPMGRAAGATALLNHELDRLAGQAIVSSRFARGVERDMDKVSQSTRRTSADINQLSGRLSLLARFMGVFGPTASPISAVAVAGVAGIASQLGFAATGALSLLVAVQGVGDALKVVEEARLEPTAANLAKAEQAMAKLAPEAREFVTRFQEIRPVLGDLQEAAARGWFPGLTQALGSLEKAAPRIERILEAVSTAGGNAVADGARSLAGNRWADFFDFIEAEAPQAISDLSRTVGSLTHGLAELWMAFDPVNDDVRDWLVDVADSFDDWAAGLDETEGFKEFVDYVRESGPVVADAAKAIGSAILEIGEAAAPLGGPVLESLTMLADAIATIADSPLGTPILTAVTAVSALSLASRGLSAALAGANTQLKAMGVQSPRTAAALGMVQKAMLALVGIEIGTQVLDGIRDSAVGAAPSVEKLSTSLQGLDASGLREELGGSLKELADAANQGGLKTLSADLAKAVDNATLLGVNIGGVFKAFAPQLGYMGVETEKAKKAAASLDQALVQMIGNVGADETKRAFDDLAKSEGLSASAKRDLIKLLPGYKGALEAAGVAADGAVGPTDDLADSVEKLKTAYSDLDAVLNKQAAWDAYQAAIDNMTASVKENGKTLDANTEKGRANREALNQIAESALQFAEHLDEADRGDFLRAAIRNFKQGAEEAGGLDKRARELLRALRELANAHADPKITADTAAAKAALQSLKAQLDSIRSKDITVSTTFKNFYENVRGPKGNRGGATDPFRGPLENPADGGTIPRFGGRPIRSDAGSTVPDDGGGYRDYLLYMLAPLEEVISNRRGQADEFRAELKDINAGMSRAEVVERMLARGIQTRDTYALASGGAVGNWTDHVEKNQEMAA